MAGMDTIYMLGIADIICYLDMELPFYIKKDMLGWINEVDMYEHFIGHALSDAVFTLTGKNLCSVNHYNDACNNCYDDMRIWLVNSVIKTLVANKVNFDNALRVKYLVSRLALVVVVVR